jgi:GT2 family glycosyltransferase
VSSRPVSVAALIASHDRRSTTLRCLASLFRQEAAAELSVVLVDDGSTDGTAAAVRTEFPDVRVIVGSGSLYWAGAMALGEPAALASGPDYLLWLNDDVELAEGALEELLETSRPDGAISVGALNDPATGELSYSGVCRVDWHPLRFRLVPPGPSRPAVSTFNGNVVLIPREALDRIGAIDGGFVHGAADFDYGLRARRAGVPIRVTSRFVGACARHENALAHAAGLPWSKRLHFLLGPKGLPPRAYARYLRRHGGAVWPLFWLGSYRRVVAALIRPSRAAADRWDLAG